MRRIGVEERRARLGLRHRLATQGRAADAVAAAEALVGLHATDPASVFLAAWARMRDPNVEALERALYDERTLLRMLGMRRTMFVLPLELAAIVQAACTRAIAARLRQRLVGFLAQAEIGDDPERWLGEVEEETLGALAATGEATGAELSREVPRLREQLLFGEGRKWETRQGVTFQLLALLSAEGRIVRGRPRGSWTSSQYRWAPVASWLPDGLAEWPVESAQTELARRWLAAFGPATAADLRWWTGWTAAAVKRALTDVGPAEVELDGGTGLVLPDDLEPVAPAEPWAALLPSLDPTVMGWLGREWYLGPHAPALFDRSGNAGPTVWWEGRVVGGWGQRQGGEIAVRLLEDVGGEARAAVEAAAETLSGRLGGVRVTPRFRTPLERELAT